MAGPGRGKQSGPLPGGLGTVLGGQSCHGAFLPPGSIRPALLLPSLVVSFRTVPAWGVARPPVSAGRRPRRPCSGIGLGIERFDVIAARIQVLAAGQAPWAAHRLAAMAADPEPGRVVPAVDAELDGVRQQAGYGYRAPPGVRGRGSGTGRTGRHARVRCRRLDEPSGEAIAAWSADQAGFGPPRESWRP